MKRILLTGGCGFAGYHFLKYGIENTDHEFVVLDDFRHMGDSQRAFHNERIKYFTHDCATPISDVLTRKIGKIDCVVNMAANSHVDRSIDDPRSFIYNNTAIATEIAMWAVENKVMKFIQISTDEVYGPALEDVNHKEWSEIIPSNPYAASKACQEAVVISFWRTYGLPLMITNTMNMFGEKQNPEKYVPMCISKIMKDEFVTIHGDLNGYGSRKYLHAGNHASALFYLLDKVKVSTYESGSQKPDRFNIVGDDELNNHELATMIAELMGKELRFTVVDFHKARPGHDKRYSLDGNLMKELGWVAPYDLKTSMKQTIDWFLENKEWA